jgi:hypothetical protein
MLAKSQRAESTQMPPLREHAPPAAILGAHFIVDGSQKSARASHTPPQAWPSAGSLRQARAPLDGSV